MGQSEDELGALGSGSQTRYLLLGVTGVVLAVGAVLVGLTGLTGTYAHTVDYDIATDRAESLAFDDLSPGSQAIVEDAIEADSTVWTTESRDAFEYPRGTGGAMTYTITYQDRTVPLKTERDRQRTTAWIVGSLRVSGVVGGALVTFLSAVSLAAGRYAIPDAVQTRIERWVPFVSYVVLGLPLVPLVFFAALYPYLELFGSLHGLEFWVMPVYIGVVGFGGIAGTTGVVLRYTGVNPVVFVVSVLAVPPLWAAVVWVGPANAILVGLATFYLALTVPVAVIGHSIGWEVHERLGATTKE